MTKFVPSKAMFTSSTIIINESVERGLVIYLLILPPPRFRFQTREVLHMEREGEGRGGVRKLRVFFRSSHNLFIVVLAHLSSSPQSRSLRNPAAVLNILSPSLLL